MSEAISETYFSRNINSFYKVPFAYEFPFCLSCSTFNSCRISANNLVLVVVVLNSFGGTGRDDGEIVSKFCSSSVHIVTEVHPSTMKNKSNNRPDLLSPQ